MKKVKLAFALAFLVALTSCKKTTVKPKAEGELEVQFLAGVGQSFSDGKGADASFFLPKSLAVDASGNIFIPDLNNSRIRKITPSGVVTTIAGNGTIGYADGTGTAAKFNYGDGYIAIDSQGNLYITDPGNSCVRKITQSGVVTTIAGKPGGGSSDGPAASAGFSFGGLSGGICVDAANNIYVSDDKGIRKISSDGTTVSTLIKAGSSNIQGPIATAGIQPPQDIAIDASGNIYALCNNQFGSTPTVQRIGADGNVKWFAGSTTGFTDGLASIARFAQPRGICVDKTGNIYVTEFANRIVRKITPQGNVSLFAGIQTTNTDQAVILDGPVLKAKFKDPTDVAVSNNGDVYVLEQLNGMIRKITMVEKEKSQGEFEVENWNKPIGWK